MKPHLKVIDGGMHTTVQDAGRFEYQHLGVPVSGALDTVSLRLANMLVGNDSMSAGLELLYVGPTLEVCADSTRVALVGTASGIERIGARPCAFASSRSVRLRRGDKFRIAAFRDTGCCYLAVEGGFDLAECMGSLATYTRGGFGGFEGRALETGDELPLNLAKVDDRGECATRRPHGLEGDGAARIVLGPQEDWFTDRAIEEFLSMPFTVSAQSDRMGMRLDGPTLAHRNDYNIVSDGIATGAVQVPGSGLPIVLLADHQTTGGYPKIATVISADLPRLGRMRPGDSVAFVAVDVAEAEAIRRRQEAMIEKVAESLEPVRAQDELDLESLYSENLISGVVNGSP
jgi:biotin-dependent carboxylase-like uncharacterized protein